MLLQRALNGDYFALLNINDGLIKKNIYIKFKSCCTSVSEYVVRYSVGLNVIIFLNNAY